MKYKMCPYETIRSEFSDAVKHAYESKNIDILQKRYDIIKAGDTDKRTVLDQVTRDCLLQLLAQGSEDVQNWESFVNFCILACRKDMCTPTMPVVLLGDVFDALTLDKCEKLFEFVEKGVNVWKEDLFFSACKNNLLRMCNGLNIVSEFNLDNLTEFGNDTGSPLKDIITDAETDAVEEDVQPDTKFKIDYNLYCKFWALQDFFRNPNQCYNKVNWKTFSTHAVNVLLAFSSFKLEDVQGKQLAPPPASSTSSGGTASRPHYFAKFLTNQKLLELQLSDSNFRRYVLLQFLIVFQYLHSPAEWVRDTTQLVYKLLAETPPDGPAFVRAVQHILKREEHWNAWKNDGCPEFTQPAPRSPGGAGDAEGSGGATAAAAGGQFGGRVAAGCAGAGEPARRRATRPRRARRARARAGLAQPTAAGRPGPATAAARPRRARKRLGELMREAAAHKRFNMGNPELTRLWNLCPNNLEACKSRERDFLPSLEAYFEEAIEQTDPAALVEEQYKRVNDGNFGWRALRLLARRSPHFFTHSNNPINKLPEYLENMIKKISKDRPSLQSGLDDAGRADGDSEMQTAVKEEEEEELLKGGGGGVGVGGVGADDDVDADDAGGGDGRTRRGSSGAARLRRGRRASSADGDVRRRGRCVRRAEATPNPGDPPSLSPRRLAACAAAAAPIWRRLAAKLGYSPDEILYFEGERSDDTERCRLILELWAEDEDDSAAAQLAYVLEGLGADAAASALHD
ncbi:THO complex subunit 1 [Gryllus bimaculatus]|nr:THO complex subunit 1 [Gryllus bimaculatus]